MLTSPIRMGLIIGAIGWAGCYAQQILMHMGLISWALVEWGGVLNFLGWMGETFDTPRLNMVVSSTQDKGND
jgi:hypothetical protein